MIRKLWHELVLLIALTGIVAPVSAGIVQATNNSKFASIGLESGDYYAIFLFAIILINLFLVLLYKIFHRKYRIKKISGAVNVIGSTVAFLCVAAGSVMMIVDGLVLMTVSTGTTSFIRAYYVMLNLFDDIVFGIIISGATGALLFLVGLYILILLHGNPLSNTRGMPSVSGAIPKGIDAENEIEPLNPTLTFRVVGREGGKTGADVKVILRQREGIGFHTKFTNFNGEVQFQNIEGYATDFYAYVEGDEKREIFKVIQV
jgi:hypothetical protein